MFRTTCWEHPSLAKQIFGPGKASSELNERQPGRAKTRCRRGVKPWPRFLHDSLCWRREKILLIHLAEGRDADCYESRRGGERKETRGPSRKRMILSFDVPSCDRSCIMDSFWDVYNEKLTSFFCCCCSYCICISQVPERAVQVYAVKVTGSAGARVTVLRNIHIYHRRLEDLHFNGRLWSSYARHNSNMTAAICCNCHIVFCRQTLNQK